MKNTKKDKIEIDEEFIEDDDKRVIVFTALSLLIIIATVIGLLVSHQKKEITDDIKEPHKDYITPEPEIGENKENIEGIVKQVKIVINEKEVIIKNDDITYEITYHYNDKTYVTKTNDKVDKYIPEGFDSCKYYTDENYTNEYNFNEKVTSSKNIYLNCEEKTYIINYSHQSNNKNEYKLSDGTIKLSEPQTDLIFEGWYTDENYTNKVTSLDKNIIKYNNNGIINLYAKTVEYYRVNYYDNNLNIIESYNVTKDKLNDYEVLDASYLSNENNKFLGWSKKENNMIIDYTNNETMNISSDINLYAVFGSSIIEFVDNDKLIERRGLTKEEAQDFELPTEEDLGLEAPTYIVPVDNISDKTKTIVSDDTDSQLENEIKLSDALLKKSENYNPKVGDKVEEIEKELNWLVDKNVTDPITGEETIEKVTDEEEIKEIIKNNTENNSDTELKTEWVEK